eukprot:1569606-Prymnesium_polylepis.1
MRTRSTHLLRRRQWLARAVDERLAPWLGVGRRRQHRAPASPLDPLAAPLRETWHMAHGTRWHMARGRWHVAGGRWQVAGGT